MKNLLTTVAVFYATVALLHGCPAAQAAQIGQSCTPTPNVATVKSDNLIQGVIECIPDSSGNYFWQPMGAGIARYDNTGACSIAGSVRWNGSVLQFCDGTSWQSIGGTTVVVGGCQYDFSGCPSGYRATSYFSPGTYNCCDKCGEPSWKYTVCSQ